MYNHGTGRLSAMGVPQASPTLPPTQRAPVTQADYGRNRNRGQRRVAHRATNPLHNRPMRQEAVQETPTATQADRLTALSNSIHTRITRAARRLTTLASRRTRSTHTHSLTSFHQRWTTAIACHLRGLILPTHRDQAVTKKHKTYVATEACGSLPSVDDALARDPPQT